MDCFRERLLGKRRSDPAFGTIASGAIRGATVRQSYKTFFLWAVLILLFFSFFQFFRTKSGGEPREIDASDFYQAVDRGEVQDATVKGNVLQGHLKSRQEFRTVSPLDPQLLDKMRQKNVVLRFEKEDSQSLWAQVMVS